MDQDRYKEGVPSKYLNNRDTIFSELFSLV